MTWRWELLGQLYKLFRPIIRLMLRAASLLIVALAAGLRPIISVRIGYLRSNRLGHLAANTELYFRRRVLKESGKREFVFFVSGQVANRQLLTMIRRRAPVVHSNLAYRLHRGLQRWTPQSPLWIDLPWKGNEYHEWNNIPPQLAFTTEEEERGKQLLASMGVEDGAAFVVFHARDRTYLDRLHAYNTRDQWSYHDFRDCDILNYLPAAEYLASSGITALRMGHIVANPLPTTTERIIDYASNYRTDFGDIYLCAKSKFFLGCTSGPLALAWTFGVPAASANWIPLMHSGLGRKDLVIPKKLWHIEGKRFLTFREIVDSGAELWLHTEQYTQAGIEVLENTSEEILALAKEMNARLDGAWVTTEEDEYLQQRYRGLIPPGHPYYGFPSRIGAQFLRDNTELLEC